MRVRKKIFQRFFVFLKRLNRTSACLGYIPHAQQTLNDAYKKLRDESLIYIRLFCDKNDLHRSAVNIV